MCVFISTSAQTSVRNTIFNAMLHEIGPGTTELNLLKFRNNMYVDRWNGRKMLIYVRGMVVLAMMWNSQFKVLPVKLHKCHFSRIF